MNQALNVNQTDQNDWPKKTWEQCPIKVIQTATRVKLSDSLSPQVHSRVYPHVLYSFPLINALLVSVLSVFVEIFFCKAKSQGPCH